MSRNSEAHTELEGGVEGIEPLPRVFRALPYLLLGGGIVGLIAAFTLTIEKIELLKDPNHQLSCSLDATVSCGDVMNSPQAEAFGFPNSVLGIICFTIVIVTAVVQLTKVKLPKWYWVGLEIGLTLGMIFVVWLMHAALFDIQRMCLYCMAVWAVMIPMWLYTTLFIVNHAYTGSSYTSSKLVYRLTSAHPFILILMYLVVMAALIGAFPGYWTNLVGL